MPPLYCDGMTCEILLAATALTTAQTGPGVPVRRNRETIVIENGRRDLAWHPFGPGAWPSLACGATRSDP
jgi:hypothetical protein